VKYVYILQYHPKELARDAEMAARENESKKRKTRVLVRFAYVISLAFHVASICWW
jgi:hypothetical protein